MISDEEILCLQAFWPSKRFFSLNLRELLQGHLSICKTW